MTAIDDYRRYTEAHAPSSSKVVPQRLADAAIAELETTLETTFANAEHRYAADQERIGELQDERDKHADVLHINQGIIAKDVARIAELQEELADRKLRRERDREMLEAAEAERDGLRCCANCRHSGDYGTGICAEEERERARHEQPKHGWETALLPVAPCGPCVFTPSRWEAK